MSIPASGAPQPSRQPEGAKLISPQRKLWVTILFIPEPLQGRHMISNRPHRGCVGGPHIRG
jgi:hypothetical protein